MEDNFLKWIADSATWWQILKICWWNRFNEEKYTTLKRLHSFGIIFQVAYKFMK